MLTKKPKIKYLEQTSDFFIKSYQVVYYSFQYASHTRTLWGSCIFNLHNLQIVGNTCFKNLNASIMKKNMTDAVEKIGI